MQRSETASLPSTEELLDRGAPVALRDGARIRLRAGQPADRQLLVRGFKRLSPESRYRRFLAPISELSETTLGYLAAVDHHDHEAIVALDDATGEGIGVARFVRLKDRPDTAEMAVTVIDDWQQRGVGTLLLDLLSERARQEAVKSFTALVLADNQDMLDVLKHLGPYRVVDRDLGTIEIEMSIPQVGLSPALRKLLRVAGRRDVLSALVHPRRTQRLLGHE